MNFQTNIRHPQKFKGWWLMVLIKKWTNVKQFVLWQTTKSTMPEPFSVALLVEVSRMKLCSSSVEAFSASKNPATKLLAGGGKKIQGRYHPSTCILGGKMLLFSHRFTHSGDSWMYPYGKSLYKPYITWDIYIYGFKSPLRGTPVLVP